MSICKKCDRCGNMYENYNYPKHDNENFNGIVFAAITERSDGYASHGLKDLCPKCMESFMNWFNRKEEESVILPPYALEKPVMDFDKEKETIQSPPEALDKSFNEKGRVSNLLRTLIKRINIFLILFKTKENKMGKSKHVGNKHLYIGTSKIPKRIENIPEDIDKHIWKKPEKKVDNNIDESKFKLQSFSYTLYCSGR